MDRKKIERLADAELDIMTVVWKSDRPLKASEITKLLSGEHTWKTQTTHVLLGRLCDKGFLEADKSGYFHTFGALISENEYFASASQTLAEKMESSIGGLIASLIDSTSITDEEISELEALLEAKRQQRRKENE